MKVLYFWPTGTSNDVWTDTTKVAVFKNFVNPKVLTLLQPKKYEKQEFLISKVGGKQLEFISLYYLSIFEALVVLLVIEMIINDGTYI